MSEVVLTLTEEQYQTLEDALSYTVDRFYNTLRELEQEFGDSPPAEVYSAVKVMHTKYNRLLDEVLSQV